MYNNILANYHRNLPNIIDKAPAEFFNEGDDSSQENSDNESTITDSSDQMITVESVSFDSTMNDKEDIVYMTAPHLETGLMRRSYGTMLKGAQDQDVKHVAIDVQPIMDKPNIPDTVNCGCFECLKVYCEMIRSFLRTQ